MLYRYFYIFLLLINGGLLLADKGQVNLLIYGDSISAGYGMDKDKQWSGEFQKILNEEKINIKINN